MIAFRNFLMFIYTNFVSILVIIGLIIGIYQKVRKFFSKTREEQIEIAKTQIKEIMLKMVSEAEMDYDDWNKSGSIKRSQVIKEIFEMYPILSKVIRQEDLVHWIDYQIDSSLETLSEVIKANTGEVMVDGE